MPNDAEQVTADEVSPTTAYQRPEAADEAVTVADVDWNRSTDEGVATKANEPDRTPGNSSV